MDDNTIELGWSEYNRSDLGNTQSLKTTTTIEMDMHQVERILSKFLMGGYQNMSKKGVQEKLKNRASKVEIEKVHYNSSLHIEAEKTTGESKPAQWK